MKKCPYCAEEIQDEATVCKHCGRDLNPKPNILVGFFVFLRNAVGLIQSLLLLGGCVAFLGGSEVLFSAAFQWFIISLVVQVGIIFMIWLFSPKA